MTEDPVCVFAREHFGINYLFPYQRLVIANVLDAINYSDDERLNQLVILPTGAGKSLCFQLPAALCPGISLVIFPLLGLMADQARRISSTGIEMATLKGAMEKGERQAAFRAISSGKAKLVLSNPETLKNPEVKKLLAESGVTHFVIDEAHCASEWGESFRPAYLCLEEQIEYIKPKIVTAFTATASPPVLSRVTKIIFGKKPYKLISGMPDRPNIHYGVIKTLSLKHSLKESVMAAQKPAIIFAQSRKAVEILAEDIIHSIPEIDCRFYHAGLEKQERANIEKWFMTSKLGVLCATCAYGMGMDKADIRSVIHYGNSTSIEAYLQEAGRAGRDGKESHAIVLCKAGHSQDHEEPSPPQSGKDNSKTVNAPEWSSINLARRNMMLRYVDSSPVCRRLFLLNALGYSEADSLVCSGCDVCNGSEKRSVDGMEEILALVKKNPRRFTIRDLSSFIHGKLLPALPYKNSLAEKWTQEETEEAIYTLIENGHIYKNASGLWKDRLVTDQSGSSESSSITGSGRAALGLLGFFSFLRALLCEKLFSLLHGLAIFASSSQRATKAARVSKTSQRLITAMAKKRRSMTEKLPINNSP